LTETIPLDRQFKEWSRENPSDPELPSLIGFPDRGLAWDDLLTKSRVVILAETGSGKSEELNDCSRRQRLAGEFAATKPACHDPKPYAPTCARQVRNLTNILAVNAPRRRSTQRTSRHLDTGPRGHCVVDLGDTFDSQGRGRKSEN
jgi:hypothetical protein